MSFVDLGCLRNLADRETSKIEKVTKPKQNEGWEILFLHPSFNLKSQNNWNWWNSGINSSLFIHVLAPGPQRVPARRRPSASPRWLMQRDLSDYQKTSTEKIFYNPVPFLKLSTKNANSSVRETLKLLEYFPLFSRRTRRSETESGYDHYKGEEGVVNLGKYTRIVTSKMKPKRWASMQTRRSSWREGLCPWELRRFFLTSCQS